MIGAGHHAAANIYPSLAEIGAKVDAVCTRSIDTAAAAIKRFGLDANAYCDIDTMLASEAAEKVVVVLPGFMAADVIVKCLQAGKEVFTEKPCGMSPEDTERILEAQRKSGRGVQVGFMKRYAPVYQRLKAAETELGELKSFDARFCVNATRFCDSDKKFAYLVALHYFDLLRFLFEEVEDISGFAARDESGASYVLNIKLQSGAVGTLSLENRGPWTREAEGITATYQNGFAETRGLDRFLIHRNAPPMPNFRELAECDTVWSPTDTPGSGTLRDLYLRGFVGEMKAFCEGALSLNTDFAKSNELCERFLEVIA